MTLYGELIHLKKDCKILNYFPADINLLTEFYTIEQKKIYGLSLSPTEVYKGIDKRSGSKVAIKELKKEKLNESFKREMAMNEMVIHDSLSKLSNNIVQINNYFEDEKAYYLIMEFSEDANYFEEMLENRFCPISDEKTLKAFSFDILTALKEIHKNNVIHCDIKPQNFMPFRNESSSNMVDESFTDDYYLKITDFGYAHIIPEGFDKTFMKYPCGTFPYTAPEITKVLLI